LLAAHRTNHGRPAGKRLTDDPDFAVVMAYVGPAGIPYSEFMRWSDFDRSAALAWRIRENQRCGSCGTVPAEWKSRDWNGDPICDEHGTQFLDRELPFHIVEESCPACK